MPIISKGYADTTGGQIHFRRVAGTCDPLVLLHRTPASSASFTAVLRLAAGRRAAIAFDTPGFGSSFVPPGRPSCAQYARWFLEALDALGVDRFHVAGHHTGTHFAVELAELAGRRARSLLLSGVLYADPEERRAMREQFGPAQRPVPSGEHLQQAWQLVARLMPTAPLDLRHAETLGAMASFDGRDQALAAITDQDFAAALGRVRCPARIAQASDDPLTPMLDRIAAAHPQVGIEMIGPAGLAAPELDTVRFAGHALALAASAELADIRPRPGDSMEMQRYELVQADPAFDLVATTVARPEPLEGEVLVRIHAVSLNRRDVMVRDLAYPVQGANHFVPLSDGAGEVVAVGPGVHDVKVGDRVCSTFFERWTHGRLTPAALGSALGAGGRGVLAEYVSLAATGVTPIPTGWSYAAAATLPCAGVTAWNALVTRGGLRPGEWVLVIGTGGVALFALQIAVAHGARVAVISSSAEKLERVRALGAEVTIDRSLRPDWDAAVREATGGVDHVLELGGAGTLARSIGALGLEGHVALIGALDGFGGEISAMPLILGTHRIGAVTVGSRADQAALADFCTEHGIAPVIDSAYEIGDVDAAYDRVRAGAFGKVVVRL